MTVDQLRKSILQQAIQGKLVPQDPNDEPASVLLERIREEKASLVKEKKIKKEKNPSIIFRGEDNSHYEKFILTGEVKCIDDEIPFDLPKGWEWCRLGEIGELINGRAYKKEELLKTGKYRVLRVGNLFTNNEWFYSNLELPKEKYCQAGDLLYAWSASFGPYIWNGAKTIFHYHIWNVRYNQSIVTRDYLYYFLEFDKSIIRNSTTGTTMIHISMENMNPRFIPLPPLAEQQRIVAKIEELMPLVEQYGKAQSKLETLNSNIREQLKKSVLQYAIEGKLVPQCEEDGTAEDLLQEIQAEKQRLYTEGKLKKKDLTHSTIFRGEDNKYFEKKGEEIICIDEEIPFDIPDSWEWVRLGCISKFSIGKTPERGNSRYWENGVYPWVSISDMKPNEYIHSTREKVSQDAVDKCFGDISPKGSLLMSFKLTIGRTSILQMESYHNEAIVTLTPFIDLNYTLRNYLFYILPVTSNMGESNDAIKGKTLNSKSLFNILIPLPPMIEQQKIIHKIEVVASIMSR